MKAVKTILIGLCIFALIYLMMSFIIWDLNAGNWSTANRYLVACIGSLVSIFVAVFYNQILDN